MLHDTERDVGGQRGVADRESAQLHGGERHGGEAPAGAERVEAPIHARGPPTPLAEQHDVLAQAAARLEHDAVAW